VGTANKDGGGSVRAVSKAFFESERAKVTPPASTGNALAVANVPTLSAPTGTMPSYPGYTGALKVVVKGLHFLYPADATAPHSTRDGIQVYFDMQVDEASTSGGLHIHTGTTCDAAGGHYYNASKTSTDPWTTAWASDAASSAAGSFEVVGTGYPHADTVGHVVVVHASDGTRIACTNLVDVAGGMAIPATGAWGRDAAVGGDGNGGAVGGDGNGGAAVGGDGNGGAGKDLQGALAAAKEQLAVAKERYAECIVAAPAAQASDAVSTQIDVCDAYATALANAAEAVKLAQSKVDKLATTMATTTTPVVVGAVDTKEDDPTVTIIVLAVLAPVVCCGIVMALLM